MIIHDVYLHFRGKPRFLALAVGSVKLREYHWSPRDTHHSTELHCARIDHTKLD